MGSERVASVKTNGGALGDVVCLGETMTLFVSCSHDPGNSWWQTIGGAESNVACHLAGAGLWSRWVGAVGADPFGQAVLDGLAEAGVDTANVRVDPDRSTGVYFKNADPTGSRVHYYRAGSAATAMGPDLLEELDLSGTSLLHLTGITPALSARCRDLVHAVLERQPRDVLISLDVNWRPALWSAAGAEEVQDPADLLRAIADRADVVLVGDDEAEALWQRSSVDGVRDLLPQPRSLVIKHGARGATLVEDGRELFEPALGVDVVEPVGAGDAFAAGFLAATLRGYGKQQRLRAGHLQAASVLCTTDDVSPSLEASSVARMLVADERAWARARVTKGEIIE